MRRALLISVSLVLALIGWSAACADDGFYVVPAMKGNYAPVPKTGQKAYYGPNDDGTLEKGVALPTPRFTNNGNGTVTDNLTGLIWTKNAAAFSPKTWEEALSAANSLESGSIPDLNDGSKPGDWRLPNVRELQSLIDYGKQDPALPELNPFDGVLSSYYWSSTTDRSTLNGWIVYFYNGGLISYFTNNLAYVWCVRGGK